MEILPVLPIKFTKTFQVIEKNIFLDYNIYVSPSFSLFPTIAHLMKSQISGDET